MLRYVRTVSLDKIHNSIEFNEFLLLISKHQEESLTRNSLMEAFKVFDPSASGFVSFDCFRGIMTRYDKVVGSYFLDINIPIDVITK